MDSEANALKTNAAIRAALASAISTKRVARPGELATTALLLASDEPSLVAGIDLAVDGRMIAV
jgi:NAD(P)-dependent dehydrogenase (short-subunit alcohol dehydrogenase family)